MLGADSKIGKRVRAKCFEAFKRVRTRLPSDIEEWKRTYFPEALSLLERDSSVGNSVMKTYGSTIGTALGWDGWQYDPARVEFLRRVVELRIEKLLEGDLEADPLNVFIKDEPHKSVKAARHRLILAVSLEDAMVDRMLFVAFQARVVDKFMDLPVKIGWSQTGGGYKRLYRDMNRRRKVALDRSAWDWMVPPYLVEYWKRFLLDMFVEPAPWLEALVVARIRLLFEPGCKIRFRDGTRYVQDFTGLMKSGCYLTLLLNSVSQYMLHWMAVYLLGRDDDEGFFFCMGDDTIQAYVDWLDEYLVALRALGVSIKDPVIRDYAEFCGFAFDSRTCVPVYWRKHLYKMLCDVRPSWVQTVVDYSKLYAHSYGMREFANSLLRRASPGSVLPYWVGRDLLEG